MPNTGAKSPIEPMIFEARLKPPITRYVPDEQGEPIRVHLVGMAFPPMPSRALQRLAHAAFYGIPCQVRLVLPIQVAADAIETTAVLNGPKAGKWEDEGGEMRTHNSLVLEFQDEAIDQEALEDIARAAFPTKGPRTTVHITPSQEQLSMDDAANAVGDAVKFGAEKGFEAEVGDFLTNAIAKVNRNGAHLTLTIGGKVVDTDTGELTEETMEVEA